MTAGEKVEQLFTSWPNSYVPVRTLLSLLGQKPDDGARPPVWNHATHWGTGAVLGALRGVWAVTGLRGPVANSAGVGAPPASWPVGESVADVSHKAAYSWVTGAVCDAWIAPVLESRRGTASH